MLASCIPGTLAKLTFWWYQTYLLVVRGHYIATPEGVAQAIDDSQITEALLYYDTSRRDPPGHRADPACLLIFHPIVNDMIARLSELHSTPRAIS